MQKPELLSPVSDFTSLNAAIQSGADAVYFGLKKLNMRATAKNFKTAELKKATDICHKNKVRAFLTLNTIVYDSEISELKKILKSAKEAKIDAIICWDPSVIKEAKKLNLEIHLSTQASVSNTESAKFYKSLGVKRIVLARELSLEQIKKIKKQAKIEVECFIHGAMCVSISGRCFLSQFAFGRSANRGDCLQPCRRTYLIQDKEENFKYNIEDNNILSPSDLCTLEFIDKLIEAKIDAFKIEGRSRSPEYVATVTKVYRTAIDAYFKKKLTKELKQELLNKLKEVYNRGFGKGFYLGKPINEWASSESKSTKKKIYIGCISNYYQKQEVAEILIEGGNLKLGDKIIIQGPTTGSIEQEITSMQINHKEIQSVIKGQRFGLKTNSIVRRNDKIYLIVDTNKA
jgi:U32 family peptidase